MIQYDAILKNVEIVTVFGDGNWFASGNIYDDSKRRFPNGKWIHTSNIRGFEGNIIQTANTRYMVDNFTGQIGDWIQANSIDFTTHEGQLAVKLRWF